MNPSGSETLFTSIKRGNLAEVVSAIERGAPLNEARTDILPLMLAVRERQVAIAEKLIDEGADANATNNFGWTALLEATRLGQMEMVEMLDTYEINFNAASSRGDGLLHAAVQGNTKGMVPFFIERNVPVDRPNRNGVTPVMMAAERRSLESFRELVVGKADLDRQDSSGMSARQRAAHWPEVADLLSATPVKSADEQVKAVETAVAETVAGAPEPRRGALSGISKRSGGMR